MDVVLIHLGSRTPAHVRASAAQVEAVAGRPPLLVGALRGARYRGRKLRRFRGTEALTEMGLGGFWRYTAERFFVLEEHMRAIGLDRCLHIESDCLVYAPPSRYEGWLTEVYGGSIAICPLTSDQDTAAVMYVGSLRALSEFNDGLLDLVALDPARLLENHGGEMANDMRMIRLLRDGGLAEALPTTVESAQALGSRYVFDPASYGQFVDGTPGAPGVPYAGEHHELGPELRSGRLRIVWDAQRCSPAVIAGDQRVEHPLANLHVHSKRLGRCLADPLSETRRRSFAVSVSAAVGARLGPGLKGAGRLLNRRVPRGERRP